MVHSKCGDDNVQSGNGQNIIRVDPCLKLFFGCPLMVSTNDHKHIGVVKGTTAKFRGVQLKENKNMKMEIWNGYKVYTVDAKDVEYIICDHVKKDDSEPTRSFKLPTKSFPVTVKFPIGGSKFLKLEKARIIQFPINNLFVCPSHICPLLTILPSMYSKTKYII